mgnify:CR=1 FL=1
MLILNYLRLRYSTDSLKSQDVKELSGVVSCVDWKELTILSFLRQLLVLRKYLRMLFFSSRLASSLDLFCFSLLSMISFRPSWSSLTEILVFGLSEEESSELISLSTGSPLCEIYFKRELGVLCLGVSLGSPEESGGLLEFK